MKKPVVQEKTASPAEKEVKKTPAIILLSDDALESVVGAGRCPPEDIGHLVQETKDTDS